MNIRGKNARKMRKQLIIARDILYNLSSINFIFNEKNRKFIILAHEFQFSDHILAKKRQTIVNGIGSFLYQKSFLLFLYGGFSPYTIWNEIHAMRYRFFSISIIKIIMDRWKSFIK